MSEDRKRLEEQVLNQTLPIPEITETKIQAAYSPSVSAPCVMSGPPAWLQPSSPSPA